MIDIVVISDSLPVFHAVRLPEVAGKESMNWETRRTTEFRTFQEITVYEGADAEPCQIIIIIDVIDVKEFLDNLLLSSLYSRIIQSHCI